MTFISKKRILNFAAGGTPQNKPKTFDRTTLAKQPVLSGSSSFQHLSTRSSSLWRRWENPEPPKDWSVLLLTIFIKLLRGTFASSSGNLALQKRNNRSFWMTLDSFSCFYMEEYQQAILWKDLRRDDLYIPLQCLDLMICFSHWIFPTVFPTSVTIACLQYLLVSFLCAPPPFALNMPKEDPGT